MALTKVSTDGVKDDAVTTDKLANAINTERTANTAKVSTTINNNADNRVITGSGTANTLEGESNLTFTSNVLKVQNGVSDANDSNLLHVVAGGTATRGLMIGTGRSTGASQNDGMVYYDAIDSESNEYGAQHIFRRGGHNNMVIGYQSNNYVGIGTDSPSNLLHCATSDTTVARLESTASGGTGVELLFHHNSPSPADGDNIGAIYFQADDDAGNKSTFGTILVNAEDVSNGSEDGHIRFETATNGTVSEKMRIASNGEVGINVTDPETYGTGTGFKGLVVQAPSGNNSGITIRSNYAGGGLLAFADGSGSGAERKNLALQASHVNKRLDVLVDNAGVARFTEHGFTPNPSDSAAANALDDYEEGTYTPADDSGNGITYTNNSTARYVKIGMLVYVQFDVTLTNCNNLTTQSALFTLPFSLGHSYGSGVIGWTDLNKPCQVHIASGGAYLMDNDSDTSIYLKNSQLNNKRFIGSMHYVTTT